MKNVFLFITLLWIIFAKSLAQDTVKYDISDSTNSKFFRNRFLLNIGARWPGEYERFISFQIRIFKKLFAGINYSRIGMFEFYPLNKDRYENYGLSLKYFVKKRNNISFEVKYRDFYDINEVKSWISINRINLYLFYSFGIIGCKDKVFLTFDSGIKLPILESGFLGKTKLRIKGPAYPMIGLGLTIKKL